MENNNTLNTIPKFKYQEKQGNWIRLFDSLNANSQHYQQLRKTKHHFLDLDEDVSDYYDLTAYELSFILFIISDNTQKDGFTVTFLLDHNVITFITANANDWENEEVLRIHDLSWKEQIEYILNIIITDMPQELSKVSIDTFKKREDEKLKIGFNEQKLTLISESQVRKALVIQIEDLKSLKLGIEHINHVVVSTPGFHWLRPDESLTPGINYKTLSITDDFNFELELYWVKGRHHIIEYKVELKTEDFIDENVDALIDKDCEMVFCNQTLLKEMRLLTRGERIADILE